MESSLELLDITENVSIFLIQTKSGGNVDESINKYLTKFTQNNDTCSPEV